MSAFEKRISDKGKHDYHLLNYMYENARAL